MNLCSNLTLNEVPWLEGEIFIQAGKKRIRVFGARLNMETARLILSTKKHGQVADVSGKTGEPSDSFGKWAYDVMKSLGSGAVHHYPKMNIGSSISHEETIDKLPPAIA